MQILNRNFNPQVSPAPNFSGHAGFEKLPFHYGMRNGVTTETRLFRDYKSIKFALNYIDEVFKGNKNIVVGACATGEDVFSIKMLRGKKQTKITAFDLGSDTITNAKSGTIEIDIPADEKSKQYVEKLQMDAYNDKFLTGKENLNEEEKYLKQLFEDNFEPIESKTKLIYKIKEKLKKIFFTTYVEFDKKFFRIKDIDKNCEFKNGNIMDLEKTLPLDRSNHLFTFKNAMYHLITDNNYCQSESLEPAKATAVLNKIFTDINKALVKKGLFVMGELEHLQHNEMHLVDKSLLEHGFLPVRMPDRPYLNIWKKVKEVD